MCFKQLLRKLVLNLVLVFVIGVSVIFAIPQEFCVRDIQCHDFCQKYGYNKAFCQMKWSTQLSKIQMTCQCNECDPLKCMSHCYKRKLQFSGCICYNLLIPGGPLFGIYNKINLNDCTDDNLFCQCGRQLTVQ